MRPATLRKLTSAGGVVYRMTDGSIQIALVSVRHGKTWCLPKGLMDRGETPEMTALREVREETGLTGRIVHSLGEVSYWYYAKGENAKCRKTVHFYLMEYVSGNTEDHDQEVDRAEWLPLDEAFERLSYRGDKTIARRAMGILRDIYGKGAGPEVSARTVQGSQVR